MKVNHTSRGFEILEGPIRLQQSSAIGDYEDAMDKPGSSFLWYEDEHLSRETVKDMLDQNSFPDQLIPHVRSWLETGSLLEKETKPS